MAELGETNWTFEALPGGDLVRQGLEDIRRGVESVPALLVRSFSPRLQRLGLEIPDHDPREDLPGHRLYKLLRESYGNGAHSKYNALNRRLVSFARAAECAS